MATPKWEDLTLYVKNILIEMGYGEKGRGGFIPADNDTVRLVVESLMRHWYGPRESMLFLHRIGKLEELGELVVQKPGPCFKISDGMYSEDRAEALAKSYKGVGKVRVAGLLFMSIGKVRESKDCFDAASSMIRSADPRSPWDMLSQSDVHESVIESIIGELYNERNSQDDPPCPAPLRELFQQRRPESQWRQTIHSGLGIDWLKKWPRFTLYDDRLAHVRSLRELVVGFSETGASSFAVDHDMAEYGDYWLPEILKTGHDVRADTICFLCGNYELAIQWALAFLELDLGWFDSVERGGFTDQSILLSDIALYLEMAGDYHTALRWFREHKLTGPRTLARLKLLAGDLSGAREELRAMGFSVSEQICTAKKASDISGSERASLKCANCGSNLEDNWKVCPVCSTSVVTTCECGQELEKHWKVCPICGANA